MKKIIKKYYLIFVPFIYLIFQLELLELRGPHWVLMPQDLGYNYLFTSLNFLNGDQVGTLIHPALFQIIFHGLVSLLIFVINGSENLFQTVVTEAEYYQKIISLVSIYISFLCVLIANKWIMDGTKQFTIVLLSQVFIFYAVLDIWILNSFGSPENFVFLCSYLMGALCIKSLSATKNYFDENKFINISSLLCAIGITSKLIALPLFIIPLLMINDFHQKINFIKRTSLVIIIISIPFFIVPANWSQLYSDIISLTKTILFENSNFDTFNFTLIYEIYFKNFLNTFVGSIFFLILYILLILINIFLSAIKKKKFENQRMFFAFFIVFFVVIMFVSLRQKYHYIHTYSPIFAMSFLILYMNIQNFISNRKNKKLLSNGLLVFSYNLVLVVPIYTYFSFYNANVNNRFSFLKETVELNEIVKKELIDNNNIIVTAVQTNTWASAMDHANQVSRYKYSDLIQSLGKARGWFNFDWNNSNIVSFDKKKIPMTSLLNVYEKVFFYTNKWNYKNDRPNLKAPRFLFKTIKETDLEIFSQIIAVPITDFFSVKKENKTEFWDNFLCYNNESICIDFTVTNKKKKCIKYFQIIDEPSVLKKSNNYNYTSLSKFKIMASNDKENWVDIVSVNMDKLSKLEKMGLYVDPTLKDQEKAWKIKSGFNFYRLIVLNKDKSLKYKQFNFLVEKGCV